MKWTVVVPINYGRACKTRLAGRLSETQRTDLVETMARHVLAQLSAAPSVGDIWVLSAVRPPFTSLAWIKDEERGLNAELAAARDRLPRLPLAFVHADLPFLRVDDVEALLESAARASAAIAPDVKGEGTNALAISDARPFAPAFGPGSFFRHRAALKDAAIVSSPGLAFDLDEGESLDLAMAQGFAIPYA